MKRKLNDAEVARIKAAAQFGVKFKKLGELFGIDPQNISNWASGATLDDIQPDEGLLSRLRSLVLKGE